MKKFLIAAVLLVTLSMASCTDAERSRLGSYGEKATITCYSGGQVIFETESTGKVNQERGGGLDFRDAKTGRFVRSFADCIIQSEG